MNERSLGPDMVLRGMLKLLVITGNAKTYDPMWSVLIATRPHCKCGRRVILSTFRIHPIVPARSSSIGRMCPVLLGVNVLWINDWSCMKSRSVGEIRYCVQSERRLRMPIAFSPGWRALSYLKQDPVRGLGATLQPRLRNDGIFGSFSESTLPSPTNFKPVHGGKHRQALSVIETTVDITMRCVTQHPVPIQAS